MNHEFDERFAFPGLRIFRLFRVPKQYQHIVKGLIHSQTLKEMNWSVGDKCRAVYTEDCSEYEATIESLETAEDGSTFANVVFLGYGNKQAVWLIDLLPSHGDAARALLAPVEAASEVEQPLAEVIQPAAEADKPTAEVKSEWKVGDLCRAIYAIDGLQYECTIDTLAIDSDGNMYAEVVYVDYGNKETIWVKDLLPSTGVQTVQATAEQTAEVSPDHHVEIGPDQPTDATSLNQQAMAEPVDPKPGEPVQDKPEVEIEVPKVPVDVADIKVKGKKAGTAKISSKEQMQTSVKWIKGSPCCAVMPEDGVEYEGEIRALMTDDDGNEFAVIDRIGFCDKFTAWVEDIMPTKGLEARAAQVKAAAMKKADPDVVVESITLAQGTTWKIGDPCRALYSVDGLEYEGTIEDIAKSENDSVYMTVHLLGYEERETVWLSDLLPSQGQLARDSQIIAVAATLTSDNVNEKKVKKEESKSDSAIKKEDPTTVEQQMLVTGQFTPSKVKWEKGDSCRTIFTVKGSEHEGQIVDINVEKKLAKVKFHGYEVIEIVNLSQLLPSLGVKARRAQIDFVEAAEAVKVSDESSIIVLPVKTTNQVEPEPGPTTTGVVKETVLAQEVKVSKPKSAEQSTTQAAKQDPTLPKDLQTILNKSPSVQAIKAIFTTVQQAQTLSPTAAIKSANNSSPKAMLPNEIGSNAATPQNKILRSNDSTLTGPTVSTPLTESKESSRCVTPISSQNDQLISFEPTGDSAMAFRKPSMDRFSEGGFCRVPNPNGITFQEGIIVSTWIQDGKSMCRVKIIGSNCEETIAMSQLSLSRGENARHEQSQKFASSAAASGEEISTIQYFTSPLNNTSNLFNSSVLNGHQQEVVELRAKLATTQEKYERYLEKFGEQLGKVEALSTQCVSLQMGNLNLRKESEHNASEVKRLTDNLASVQANFEVACQNIKAAQNDNGLLRNKVDQYTKDSNILLERLRASNNEINVLKKDNANLRIQLARMENVKNQHSFL